MQYIGKVTIEVIEELREKLGCDNDWAPCVWLYPENEEGDLIQLCGYYKRDDAVGSAKHPMPPSFHNLDEETHSKFLNNPKYYEVTFIEDFQPVEKWIELYNLEREKFNKR